MTSPRRPNFPSSSSDPTTQRLFSGVRELVQSFLASNDFPKRQLPARPLSVPTGSVVVLSWTYLNRLDPPYGGTVVLPDQRPEFVNSQLLMVKTSPTGMLRIIPSGRGVDGVHTPRVNAYSGITHAAAGMVPFVSDGYDWWGAF